MLDIAMLNEFVVEAKAATYVGGGVPRALPAGCPRYRL
ncbi:hypothetical protein FHX14_003580 [Rhizobium sp. BK619]|nr:hypothetical protein [Rhizobium sp. BK619]